LQPRPTTPGPSQPVLWTGPRHSGKTTAAGKLIEHARADRHTVAGILAPSVWQDDRLMGFEVLDLATGRRRRLATRGLAGSETTGKFAFDADGLALGRAALSGRAAMTADLVVVDEFGPLELQGGGWRAQVDRLVEEADGLVLLVVRHALAEPVAGLYGLAAERVIDATEVQGAIEAVLASMASRS